MHRFLAGLAIALITLLAASPSARAAEVVLAHPGSPYIDAVIAVMKAIVEDRLSVQVRTVHASAPVAFKAMDANRGDIDVGGVQLPNSQSLVDEYVTRRGTVVLLRNFWVLQQGACTTRAIADKYGIRTIYDLTRPEVVHLTAKAGDAKGEYWVGAADWNSTAIDKVRARFYGIDQLYALTTSQADLEYSRVNNALKTGGPIFWACDSASNFIFPKGSLAMLEEPAHDAAKWHPVLPSQDPDWYQKSDIQTSWPPVHVTFGYAKHLQTDLPEVARFLEGMQLTAELVGTWTYATFTEKHDLDEYARQWVAANPALVNSWLAP